MMNVLYRSKESISRLFFPGAVKKVVPPVILNLQWRQLICFLLELHPVIRSAADRRLQKIGMQCAYRSLFA